MNRSPEDCRRNAGGLSRNPCLYCIHWWWRDLRQLQRSVHIWWEGRDAITNAHHAQHRHNNHSHAFTLQLQCSEGCTQHRNTHTHTASRIIVTSRMHAQMLVQEGPRDNSLIPRPTSVAACGSGHETTGKSDKKGHIFAQGTYRKIAGQSCAYWDTFGVLCKLSYSYIFTAWGSGGLPPEAVYTDPNRPVACTPSCIQLRFDI